MTMFDYKTFNYILTIFQSKWYQFFHCSSTNQSQIKGESCKNQLTLLGLNPTTDNDYTRFGDTHASTITTLTGCLFPTFIQTVKKVVGSHPLWLVDHQF